MKTPRSKLHAPSSSSDAVVKTYKKGKLFGKLSGTFVFRTKPKEDKKRQLKLAL